MFANTLEVIENIILFSISNYFLRFSNEYKRVHGENSLNRNNWYEYVEYGTTNEITIQLHVIWNSTALDEQSKFRNFWGSTKAVRRLNDTICVENGYSIVENPKGKGKTYDKWLGDQKKLSHRERICYAIDEALAQKPQSFEKLLELLQRAGYQVKGGKVVFCGDWGRASTSRKPSFPLSQK